MPVTEAEKVAMKLMEFKLVMPPQSTSSMLVSTAAWQQHRARTLVSLATTLTMLKVKPRDCDAAETEWSIAMKTLENYNSIKNLSFKFFEI